MAKSITILVYEEFGFLDVVGPADVFTIANQRAGRTLYKLQVTAVGRKRSVQAESGMRLCVDSDIGDVMRTHTLLIAGGNGYSRALGHRRTIAETIRLARSARRVVSICTGAFLLAEAGLLDGRRATTHWAHAAEMASAYPAIDVVPDELFVASGKFVTAAGIAAGIDLALALIADDHGTELARATSQRMVLYLNRVGGQSQFSERFDTQTKPADRFDKLLASVAGNPVGNLTNAALAERLSISERHFVRLFRTRTGTTPARWVERIRIDKARERLEQSSDSIESVAAASGFASVETMRQAFLRVVGVAPGDYRKHHSYPASVHKPVIKEAQ